MILVLMGAPGAGKGTQGDLIVARNGFVKISTGDLLREEIAAKTPIGIEIEHIMAEGHLVNDDLITRMLKNRLESLKGRKILLDGYPRNLLQAKTLDDILGKLSKQNQVERLSCVIDLSIDLEKIVSRIAMRRICKGCKAIYNLLSKAPRKSDTCDLCGEALFQRDDDKEVKVRNRLRVYEEQTKPLIGYYSQKALYTSINADNDVEIIYGKLLEILKTKMK